MALDLDEIDRTILRLLQENARTPTPRSGALSGFPASRCRSASGSWRWRRRAWVRGEPQPGGAWPRSDGLHRNHHPTGRNYDEEYRGSAPSRPANAKCSNSTAWPGISI